MLDPRYKVLTVDGANVLSNTLDPATYPLRVRVALTGPEAETVAPALADVIAVATNRDPAKLTTLIMTGVTAMARNTARVMEEEGVLYPALVISDTLAAADITHVSNEIPFLDDCKVNATKNNLMLCSNDRYWADAGGRGDGHRRAERQPRQRLRSQGRAYARSSSTRTTTFPSTAAASTSRRRARR